MRCNQKSCHIIIVDSFFIKGEIKKIVCLCTTTQFCKMTESSAAVDAVTLSDHYECSRRSHGGYNIADAKFTLPNYMNHAPT